MRASLPRLQRVIMAAPAPQAIADVKPNYVELLERTLANVTATRDESLARLEGRSRVVEEQARHIQELEAEQASLLRQCGALQADNTAKRLKAIEMHDQLLGAFQLRQLVEKAQHTSQTLATALAEERAVKRARHFAIS